MVATVSPGTMNSVQWARTCTASQAAVVGLQCLGVTFPIGDEGVIAEGGQEGPLIAWGGFHPADDEPHRHGIGFGTEAYVFSRRHGGGPHPLGNGPPFRLGYGLNQVSQALVLTDGDGKADNGLAADRDHGVGLKNAVGPPNLKVGSTIFEMTLSLANSP